MSFRFLSAKSEPKKTNKLKKPKKNKKKQKKQPKSYLELLPHGFVFFGSLLIVGFCFFLCFLSCRRFLCVGAMSDRGLSSCICQRFACIDMHFRCILRTLVVPCSVKKKGLGVKKYA